MKTLFEILPAGIEAQQCILVCEVNKDCFCFTIKDLQKNMCLAVAAYTFDQFAGAQGSGAELDEAIHKRLVFADTFKKVCIIYSYDESVMVPFNLYNSSENDYVLDLIHGDIDHDSVTLTDLITEKESYNIYKVPLTILKVMSSHFPNAESAHLHSLLLRKNAPADNNLLLIFYTQKIIVCLRQNNRAIFINTFCYNTPEDVSYTLLNICAQHNISNASVEVYGFIEKEGVLFKEIYKYFDPVMMGTLPLDYNYKEEILQYPHHYFSHLFAIDSCE